MKDKERIKTKFSMRSMNRFFENYYFFTNFKIY